jgi:hypothetical protein
MVTINKIEGAICTVRKSGNSFFFRMDDKCKAALILGALKINQKVRMDIDLTDIEDAACGILTGNPHSSFINSPLRALAGCVI